jgi:hypothetical protein
MIKGKNGLWVPKSSGTCFFLEKKKALNITKLTELQGLMWQDVVTVVC